MNLYYCHKCGGEALYDIVRDKILCFECDGATHCGAYLTKISLDSQRVVLAEIEKRKEQQ